MKSDPLVLAVSGVKNSGKTRLIEALLPLLATRGVQTAVVKHDGHRFTPDAPGTDSFRFFAAGAVGSAVFDGEKFSLTRRVQVNENALIAQFPEADLVLLEGFKDSAWPKLELVRAAVGTATVCDARTVAAYVSDLPLQTDRPVFGPDDFNEIADFIAAAVGEARHA